MISEDAVLSFAAALFKSVWALELLLMLRRGAARAWGADELIRELRSSQVVIAEALNNLVVAGLVVEEEGGRFRYQGGTPIMEETVAALRAHTWPGNLRELKNVIEHAAILSEGPSIRAEHLMIQQRTSVPASRAGGPVREIQIPPEGKSLDAIEKEAVQLTLQITRGNRSAAARILGISRPTLARKMREYGLYQPANGHET